MFLLLLWPCSSCLGCPQGADGWLSWACHNTQAAASSMPTCLGCRLSFGPKGNLLQIPSPVAFPGEKQWSLPPLPSPACLPGCHNPLRHRMGRDNGASRKTIFAILCLEGQPVFLSSSPRHCPRQKIKVLWEVSKLESHPPSIPGGQGSGCGLDGISGRELQPAPL